MCGICRRAGLWVCGLVVWSIYNIHAKHFFISCFVGLWFGPNLREVEKKFLMCGYAGELGYGFVGLWYGPNMTHMQKSFIKLGFVGLWFDPNLREVKIELSMCSICSRA
jgi:hypothetical protein